MRHTVPASPDAEDFANAHATHKRQLMPPEPADAAPSKTRRKQQMHALRDLGGELVALGSSQLGRMALPEDILAAVRACQAITAHGARRRQLQYLGKLLRQVDSAPIVEGLAAIRGQSAAADARFQQLERWRSRLLADEGVLQEIKTRYPQADLTHLRQLRRNALKEQESANSTAKNFRALFQALKALVESTASAEQEFTDAAWQPH